MPDFSRFLTRPAGKGIKQKALPIEIYPGVIKTYELYESTEGNQSVVYNGSFTGWAKSITEDDPRRLQPDTDGNLVPIDISRRQWRKYFGTSEEALIYLDEFLRSCNIEPAGRSYGEVCPQAIGVLVSVQVSQQLREDTNEIVNRITRVWGPVDLQQRAAA